MFNNFYMVQTKCNANIYIYIATQRSKSVPHAKFIHIRYLTYILLVVANQSSRIFFVCGVHSRIFCLDRNLLPAKIV